ncbi:MAG: ATP-binding protein [Holophaga sp.]|nr:ATP-binding protein [Holophaga sp.]
MRELVVISGKGGTGKTSLTAAFAHLAEKNVLCDLDVDAPDLHLIAEPTLQRSGPFLAGHLAEIDPTICTGCGTCKEVCAYGAIHQEEEHFVVDSRHCEGCKVCVALCPEQAIDFPERLCGTWYESDTRFGPMVHAQLDPGQENSGKLVTLLKAKARERASQLGLELILSDGAPGIGCPVISSLSQASLVLLVTEPTPSGLHDLERVAELCRTFRIRSAVLINKADLSPEYEAAIQVFCQAREIPVVGSLPHDSAVTKAMVRGQAVTEGPDTPFGTKVRQIWTDLQPLFEASPSSLSKESKS